MSYTLAKGARPLRALYNDSPEYKAAVDNMVRAGRAWLDTLSGDVFLQFAPFPDAPAIFTGDLNETMIQTYGQNETARELLRVMDRASNHDASLAMARIAVDIIEYGE